MKHDTVVDIKLEMYILLGRIFNNTSIFSKDFNHLSVRKNHHLIQGDNMVTQFNYQRKKLEWHDSRAIYFNNNIIAKTQLKPHKVALILNVMPEHRYVRNTLIKTLHDNFPEVKVLYE